MSLMDMVIGFFYGLSLIVAIGAQNAFVLRKGLEGRHVVLVALICSVSDALLIVIGVISFAFFRDLSPRLYTGLTLVAGCYVAIYGLLLLYQTWIKSHKKSLQADQQAIDGIIKTMVKTLAFTWLNPHVYTDTVVLLGTVANTHQPFHWSFALGAVIASFCFFFSLAFLAKLMSKWLASAKIWKIIDSLIGLMMLAIGAGLIVPVATMLWF